MTREQAFGYLQITDQGQYLVADLMARRDELMRSLDKCDDCALRKTAGAIAILTDILDDFAEYAPESDGG